MCHSPKDHNWDNHYHENLKTYTVGPHHISALVMFSPNHMITELLSCKNFYEIFCLQYKSVLQLSLLSCVGTVGKVHRHLWTFCTFLVPLILGLFSSKSKNWMSTPSTCRTKDAWKSCRPLRGDESQKLHHILNTVYLIKGFSKSDKCRFHLQCMYWKL